MAKGFVKEAQDASFITANASVDALNANAHTKQDTLWASLNAYVAELGMSLERMGPSQRKKRDLERLGTSLQK